MTLTWARALHQLQPVLVNLAQSADVTAVMLQYGGIGVVALLALGAVRVLFRREVEAHDLERKRADRLEEELRRLNAAVQDRYVSTLTEATKVMSDVLDVVRARDERRP